MAQGLYPSVGGLLELHYDRSFEREPPGGSSGKTCPPRVGCTHCYATTSNCTTAL